MTLDLVDLGHFRPGLRSKERSIAKAASLASATTEAEAIFSGFAGGASVRLAVHAFGGGAVLYWCSDSLADAC